MARGWESKAVEAQQDEARRGGSPQAPDSQPSPDARAREARRRVLQLARARTVDDRSRAKAPAQRAMLERALADLDRVIGGLDVSSS